MRGDRTLRTVRQLRDLRGRYVVVRVDYNVPLEGGKVIDAERIERSVPTLKLLAERGARIVLVTHLGRPEGKRDPRYSVKPLVPHIERTTKLSIRFANDCIGPEAERAVSKIRDGQAVLLENVRYYSEETDDNIVFASQLALHGEYFVNEAFSCSHRAHASLHAITRLLPSYAGVNFEQEVEALDKVVRGFEKPSVAIVGGAKISTKIGLIGALARMHTRVLIGGGIASTLLAARGMKTGASLVEREHLDRARALWKAHKHKLIIPLDVVVCDEEGNDRSVRIVSVSSLKSLRNSWRIVDIGPKTEKAFAAIAARSRTIVWNGPLGLFEDPRFAQGTATVVAAVAEAGRSGAFTVVGGGETIAALKSVPDAYEAIDWVSTAGGAMLEYLEGKKLPGVEELMRRGQH